MKKAFQKILNLAAATTLTSCTYMDFGAKVGGLFRLAGKAINIQVKSYPKNAEIGVCSKAFQFQFTDSSETPAQIEKQMTIVREGEQAREFFVDAGCNQRAEVETKVNSGEVGFTLYHKALVVGDWNLSVSEKSGKLNPLVIVMSPKETVTQLEVAGPASVGNGFCSSAFSVAARNGAGGIVDKPNVQILLAPTAGKVYLNSNCSAESEINSAGFLLDSQSKSFYFKHNQIARVTISVTTSDSIVPKVDKVIDVVQAAKTVVLLPTAPFSGSFKLGACGTENKFELEIRDINGSTVSNHGGVTASLSVQLSNGAAYVGAFYDASDCSGTAYANGVISVPNGVSKKAFYFKPTSDITSLTLVAPDTQATVNAAPTNSAVVAGSKNIVLEKMRLLVSIPGSTVFGLALCSSAQISVSVKDKNNVDVSNHGKVRTTIAADGEFSAQSRFYAQSNCSGGASATRDFLINETSKSYTGRLKNDVPGTSNSFSPTLTVSPTVATGFNSLLFPASVTAIVHKTELVWDEVGTNSNLFSGVCSGIDPGKSFKLHLNDLATSGAFTTHSENFGLDLTTLSPNSGLYTDTCSTTALFNNAVGSGVSPTFVYKPTTNLSTSPVQFTLKANAVSGFDGWVLPGTLIQTVVRDPREFAPISNTTKVSSRCEGPYSLALRDGRSQPNVVAGTQFTVSFSGMTHTKVYSGRNSRNECTGEVTSTTLTFPANVSSVDVFLKNDKHTVETITATASNPKIAPLSFSVTFNWSQFDYDNTFGVNGTQKRKIETLASADVFRSIYSMVVASTTKLVAAGTTKTGSVEKAAVGRLSTSGDYDTAFGTNGIVTQLVGTNTRVNASITSNGKIILVGQTTDTGNSSNTTGDMLVMRLNEDGSADTSFNGNGIVKLNFQVSSANTEDEAFAVVANSSGELFVAGTIKDLSTPSNVDVVVAKITNAGGMVPTWGNGSNGTTQIDFNATTDDVKGLSFNNDGSRLLVVGSAKAGTSNANLALAQLDASTGLFDTGFNTTGKRIESSITDDTRGISALADGTKYFILSEIRNQPPTSSPLGNIMVSRYTITGLVDNTFGPAGSNGHIVTDIQSDDKPATMLLDVTTGTTKKLIVVGTRLNGATRRGTVMSINLSVANSYPIIKRDFGAFSPPPTCSFFGAMLSPSDNQLLVVGEENNESVINKLYNYH